MEARYDRSLVSKSLRITEELGSVQPRGFNILFSNYFTNKSKSSGKTKTPHAGAYKLLPRAQPPHRGFALSNRMRAPSPAQPQNAGHVGGVAVCAPARRRPTAAILPRPYWGEVAVGAAPQAPPPAGARAGARAPGDGSPALKGRRLRRPLGPRRREGRYGGRRAGATGEGRTAAGT